MPFFLSKQSVSISNICHWILHKYISSYSCKFLIQFHHKLNHSLILLHLINLLFKITCTLQTSTSRQRMCIINSIPNSLDFGKKIRNAIRTLLQFRQLLFQGVHLCHRCITKPLIQFNPNLSCTLCYSLIKIKQ